MFRVKEIKNIREEDRVYEPSSDASTTEKILFYKRTLLVAIPAFLVLSVITFWDLKKIELGTVESVSLWGPISLIYDFLGHWAAVATTPLLGVLAVVMLLRKIKALKNTERS